MNTKPAGFMAPAELDALLDNLMLVNSATLRRRVSILGGEVAALNNRLTERDNTSRLLDEENQGLTTALNQALAHIAKLEAQNRTLADIIEASNQ